MVVSRSIDGKPDHQTVADGQYCTVFPWRLSAEFVSKWWRALWNTVNRGRDNNAQLNCESELSASFEDTLTLAISTDTSLRVVACPSFDVFVTSVGLVEDQVVFVSHGSRHDVTAKCWRRQSAS